MGVCCGRRDVRAGSRARFLSYVCRSWCSVTVLCYIFYSRSSSNPVSTAGVLCCRGGIGAGSDARFLSYVPGMYAIYGSFGQVAVLLGIFRWLCSLEFEFCSLFFVWRWFLFFSLGRAFLFFLVVVSLSFSSFIPYFCLVSCVLCCRQP